MPPWNVIFWMKNTSSGIIGCWEMLTGNDCRLRTDIFFGGIRSQSVIAMKSTCAWVRHTHWEANIHVCTSLPIKTLGNGMILSTVFSSLLLGQVMSVLLFEWIILLGINSMREGRKKKVQKKTIQYFIYTKSKQMRSHVIVFTPKFLEHFLIKLS